MEIILTVLKPEKFKYSNKTYKQQRYLSDDKKFMFTVDDINYVRAYKANAQGKGEIIDDIYPQGNYSAYPIYSISDAVKKTYGKIKTKYQFKVDNSHLTNKKIKVNEALVEAKLSKYQKAYREFFSAMMDEYGVKSPVQLGDKRSEFFKRIKKEWPAAKKKIQEGVFRQTIRRYIAEFLDDPNMSVQPIETGNPKRKTHHKTFETSCDECGDVDPKAVEMGKAVEMEHTTDPEEAKKIAIDHLSEDPEYYEKLADAGLIDEPNALDMMEAKNVPDHFKKLAQVIVDKKGNFSANDFKKLNIPFEIFLQMAQVDNKTLVQNAQKVLKQ